MSAFFIRYKGNFVDAIIRADGEPLAETFLQEDESLHGNVRDDIATKMGVPEKQGRHAGALGRWLAGPTDLFGELQSKKPVVRQGKGIAKVARGRR
jgi:hypothetical protein